MAKSGTHRVMFAKVVQLPGHIPAWVALAGALISLPLEVSSADTARPCIKAGRYAGMHPLSPPGDLYVQSWKGEALTLSWPRSSDLHSVSYYEVFRDNKVVGKSTTNNWTDISAGQAGHKWIYQVEAVDASGNRSGLSPWLEVKVTDDRTFTGRIKSFSVQAIKEPKSTRVSLKWSMAEGKSCRFVLLCNGIQQRVTTDSECDILAPFNTTLTYTLWPEDFSGNRPASGATQTITTPEVDEPQLLQITSDVPDGTYGAGKTLGILVKFDKPVSCTGRLLLPLCLDAGTRWLPCSKGQGTDTLRFDYLVQPGDSSSRCTWLDVAASSDLEVKEGRLEDSSGHLANLTLPYAPEPGSLAASRHIRIRALAPRPPVVSGCSPDTGLNPRDGITTARRLMFGGSGERHAQITLRLDGAILRSGIPVNDDGTWSYDHRQVELSRGPHKLSAVASDDMGNISADSDIYTLYVYDQVPKPPANVRAWLSDSGNLISWDLVEKLIPEDFGMIIYQVYRDGKPIGFADNGSFVDPQPSDAPQYSVKSMTWAGASSDFSASVRPVKPDHPVVIPQNANSMFNANH